MTGGIEGGFNAVKPEEYRPRLVHFTGTGKRVRGTEVKLDRSSLNQGDVFLLDLGTELHVLCLIWLHRAQTHSMEWPQRKHQGKEKGFKLSVLFQLTAFTVPGNHR